MGARIYTTSPIRILSYAEQTWWFHDPAWQPGDWIRASFIADRHLPYPIGYEERVEYRSAVEIAREWTETKTVVTPRVDGSGRAGRPSIVHLVTFKLHRGSRSCYVLPRFLVVN